jgi:hypothetical protein
VLPWFSVLVAFAVLALRVLGRQELWHGLHLLRLLKVEHSHLLLELNQLELSLGRIDNRLCHWKWIWFALDAQLWPDLLGRQFDDLLLHGGLLGMASLIVCLNLLVLYFLVVEEVEDLGSRFVCFEHNNGLLLCLLVVH